jgi:Ca2+-binding EF-hand superfamily protein
MRTSQFVAFIILGASILMPFPTTTIAQRADSKQDQEVKLSHGSLPLWFRELDKDGAGQVTLQQWRNAGKPLREFHTYDLNDDGIITAEEVFRILKKTSEVKLNNGQATYNGVVEEVVDETYRGKKSFKILTVRLERGKTYQIDHISKAFQAFLYLEDADGNLVNENSSPTVGGNSRLVVRADHTGTYRLIATSQGGFRTGAFVLSVSSGLLPKGLPSWFKDLDKAGNGQITFQEWRNAGKPLAEFRAYDLNGDGIITVEEVLRSLKETAELKLKNGQATYNGAIEEAVDATYRGKKSFKILTVRLERGKTYQIDHISKAFQAFLYLEDADGNLVEENSSPNIGGNSRLVFHADKTGTYRLIATSLGGFRTGDFLLSISSGLLSGLPPWFRSLDKNGAGQITFQEWRNAGKSLAEFRTYDLNDDGIITVEEVLRSLKETAELKLNNGQATYTGAIEEAVHERYRGKKSFKIFTIRLEQGKTYQIDHISKAFQAFLYLEDPDGNLVEENSSSDIGGNSRLVVRAEQTGTYRLIATSQGGFRTGNFALSVGLGAVPKGLPPWFRDLDKDGAGQITFQEWRNAGRSLAEFHRYDLNGDGIVTAEEVLRVLKKAAELKLKYGQR